jgi:Superinfection immunity protein
MEAVILALYFIPTAVAHWRGHPNQKAILILNLFLGWTFIGWVAALVWAAIHLRDEDRLPNSFARRDRHPDGHVQITHNN